MVSHVGLISDEIIYDGDASQKAFKFTSIPQILPGWYVNHWTDKRWNELMTYRDPSCNLTQIFKEFTFLKPRQMKRILNSWIVAVYMGACVDHCPITENFSECQVPNSVSEYLPLILYWTALALSYPIQTAVIKYACDKIADSASGFYQLREHVMERAGMEAMRETKKKFPRLTNGRMIRNNFAANGFLEARERQLRRNLLSLHSQEHIADYFIMLADQAFRDISVDGKRDILGEPRDFGFFFRSWTAIISKKFSYLLSNNKRSLMALLLRDSALKSITERTSRELVRFIRTPLHAV